MREEKVTLTILAWLKSIGWKIICFDFPQSGTGKILHPNPKIRESTKNKGAIIPDIVAVKENIAVFFENKDRFVFSDFEKINELRIGEVHLMAINSLLKDYEVNLVFYGIGLPYRNSYEKKVNEHLEMVDFLIFVKSDGQVNIEFQIENIFTD